MDIESSDAYVRLRKISGPISYSLFDMSTEQNKRRLHIFGDRHDKNTPCETCDADCMEIGDLIQYITQLATIEQKYMDVFLEIPFHVGSGWVHPVADSSIYDIYSKFSSCFTKDKSNCEYLPYVRFHYIDVRHHVVGANLITLLDSLLNVGIKKYNEDVRLYVEIMSWMEWIFRHYPFLLFDIYIGSDNGKELLEQVMKNFTKNEMFVSNSTHIFRTFKSNSSIHKIRYSLLQLDQMLRMKLYDFFHDKYEKALKLIFEVLDNPRHQLMMKIIKDVVNAHPGHPIPGRNIDLNILDQYPDTRITLSTAIIGLESIFMDTYTLARYFRSWKWNNPEEAVIYAGINHTRTYEEFFTQHLNVPMIEKDETVYNEMNPLSDMSRPQCLINDRYQSIFVDDFLRSS